MVFERAEAIGVKQIWRRAIDLDIWLTFAVYDLLCIVLYLKKYIF